MPVSRAAEPDAAQGWRPALSGGAPLVVEPGGLRFPHVEGDVYQASNDPRAVFLRVPARRDQFSAEVTVEEFKPAGQFVQAGLIAWGDADNYVRVMIGFAPAGFESLAEWKGRARPQGIFPFFPDGLDRPLRLRLEVLERTVRTYLSADGGRRWFGAAGHTLPGGERCRDRIEAVGLIGTGGAATRMPRFSDWREAALPAAPEPGEWLRPELSWMKGQTNSGWGAPDATADWTAAGLRLGAYSGSDLTPGLENYPFMALPMASDGQWELLLRIADFDPAGEDRSLRAGLMLWQDSRTFLAATVVGDPDYGVMYLEGVSAGDRAIDSPADPRADLFEPLAPDDARQVGFGPRGRGEILLRLTRLAPALHLLEGSFDGTTWHRLGVGRVDLPEPQLRLLVSGDIRMESPGEPLSVLFGSLRATRLEELP